MLFNIATHSRPLNTFVNRISSGIPIRLTAGKSGKSGNAGNETVLKRYYEKICNTFARHTPPISVGRYLGTGGFSDVFEAESQYGNTTKFALKILRNDLLKIRTGDGYARDSEEMRIKDVKKRFRNESFVQWHLSQSVSKAIRNGIVRAYDHGEFDSRSDFRFILMERMGMTLRDFIAMHGSVTGDPVLNLYKARLMLRISEIISLVHDQGVFHRDIKPENILFPLDAENELDGGMEYWMRKTPRVKLADFGTVRWVRCGSDRYDGEIIGSQFYLSPEQIFRPRTLDARTDIYSFGIVCYELLYGSHPKSIEGRSMDPKLIELLAVQPPVFRTPPEGMEALHRIIFKCMRSVNSRYQTMREVSQELRQCIEESQLHCGV